MRCRGLVLLFKHLVKFYVVRTRSFGQILQFFLAYAFGQDLDLYSALGFFGGPFSTAATVDNAEQGEDENDSPSDD